MSDQTCQQQTPLSHDANYVQAFCTPEVPASPVPQMVTRHPAYAHFNEHSAYEAAALIILRKKLFNQQLLTNTEDMHPLDKPAAMELLKSYMLTIWETLPHLSGEEIGKIADLSINILYAAIVEPSAHQSKEAEPKGFNSPAMKAIRICIEDNLHDPDLSPEFIAQAVAVSAARLYRLCKPFGSPMELVRKRRLRRAHELMAAGICTSVNEVSFATGFVNRETFSRSFKRHYGVSPKDFIKAAA